MGLLNSIKKRLNWAAHVRFDNRTGFYVYNRYNKKIFIRNPRHFVPEAETNWVCEKIFFNHYLPKNNDVVLDLGAGYGEEAVYLHSKSPNVRYIGVEAQPIIYECLSNTYKNLSPTFHATPLVITEEPYIKLVSQFSYASAGESTEGYIEAPGISWEDFLKRYNIEKIDLFKMNIEGAEKDIMKTIKDFSKIKRFVISCHDFRANNGEGEFYRSKNAVTQVLKDNGYKIKTFSYGKSWSDDWIFAER